MWDIPIFGNIPFNRLFRSLLLLHLTREVMESLPRFVHRLDHIIWEMCAIMEHPRTSGGTTGDDVPDISDHHATHSPSHMRHVEPLRGHQIRKSRDQMSCSPAVLPSCSRIFQSARDTNTYCQDMQTVTGHHPPVSRTQWSDKMMLCSGAADSVIK